MIAAGVLAIGFLWGSIDALRKVLATSIPAAQLAACLMLGQLPFYVIWVLIMPNVHWSPSWIFCWHIGSHQLYPFLDLVSEGTVVGTNKHHHTIAVLYSSVGITVGLAGL